MSVTRRPAGCQPVILVDTKRKELIGGFRSHGLSATAEKWTSGDA